MATTDLAQTGRVDAHADAAPIAASDADAAETVPTAKDARGTGTAPSATDADAATTVEPRTWLRRVERSEAVSAYDRDGYMVVPPLLHPAQLAAVRAEANAICLAERGHIDGATPVDARDDELAVLARYLCIHFPHKISTLMRDLARLPGVVDRLTQVIGPNVKMMQSMLFIKSEGKPGQAWHQDEAHIPTRDRSLTGVWIALDDTTVRNGCLWVIPGSHRRGVLYPVRDQHDARFDGTPEAYGFPHGDDAVPVELAAGAAVIFDGYLLHRSLPNTATRGMRRALVYHYMSAESLLPWFPPSGQQTMGLLDHRDVVLVAGEDPHAAKGTTDVARPRLRPEG
jgi:ectoine hydroxylase-related dioxygenase (phytanoyl-CoA dioxygenase family)